MRTKVVAGKRTWTDGPFAESKELVAGFSILEVPALDDAKRFTEEYAGILGDNEVDARSWPDRRSYGGFASAQLERTARTAAVTARL